MRFAISCAAAVAAILVPASASFASDCARDTQMEINTCLSRKAGATQDRLDAAFARALKRTGDATAKANLVDSQNQWVRTRDAACDAAAAEYAGGSMQPAVYSSCIADRTAERIGVLKGIGR